MAVPQANPDLIKGFSRIVMSTAYRLPKNKTPPCDGQNIIRLATFGYGTLLDEPAETLSLSLQ
jgi:hypothetical protein